jgi:isoquinoline 1-oxidoreductase
MSEKIIAGEAVKSDGELMRKQEWEPERYEFSEAPLHHFELERRDFFKVMGGGLAILLTLRSDAFAQQGESGGRGQRGGGNQTPQEIEAWLHIGEDGRVTVFTGKVEIGQNIRTSLTQAVAEELRVAPSSIEMVMGDTDLTPFDQGTFGSQTTPRMNLQLRRAANAARDVLTGLAAQKWNTQPAGLVAKDGRISDPKSGRSIEYTKLLAGKKIAQSIPSEDPLESPSEWTVAGTPMPKIGGRDFVTGKHRYSSDMKLPGMLYGKMVRPSAFDATLISVDTKAAEAMPGVTVVHEGNFIGVAAPSEELAARAAAAIKAEWKADPQISNRELFDYLKKNVQEGGGRGEGGFGGGGRGASGSIEEGLAAAQHKNEQTYTVAYIAHAPLEPRAAVAEWADGKLNVWTGTQRPFGVRNDLAQAFRIPENSIRVRMPDMGSGYGGKHTGECAVEAARLAQAAGKPVKLVWTREEEFTWAYFRPAGVIEVRSGIKSDGTLTAWEFHNYNSGGSGLQTPYEVANKKEQFHPTKTPLRQGSYRGLAATANHFARESHMDELARMAGLDPLEFRRKNLKDDRILAVLEAAAKQFDWARRTRIEQASGGAIEKRGFGIACGVEKGGYIATCAEVAVYRPSGKVRIVRVVSAFECGAIVNPDGLRNQVEGAMVQGLGGALFEAIEFENGRILNPKFSQYRVPKASDLPRTDVVLLDRKDIAPAGAGETPIMGVAPAVGNAIFDATGVRLRSLPMIPQGLPKS